MAVGALTGRNRVSAGQNESGGAVVEAGNIDVQPVVGGVAGFAVYGELSFDVARIVGGGEVRLVAGVARRRHRLEVAGRPILVAGVAVDRSVSAGQRESVVMLLHILDRDLPSAHRVTL